ncbi:hypothetical protein BGZ76_010827 [Entomortierella beljakovae]|nr:hypothetical protein BGZ76_010827 [Entomortierella beljakovae]
MEQLVQLFPEHQIDVLKSHLDGACGILEIAIERLLSVSEESNIASSSSANLGRSTKVGKVSQINKRPRHNSVNDSFSSTGAVLLDLTIDSSDDENDDDISILPPSAWNLHFPKDGIVSSSSSTSNSLPSFDDFHSEQLKIQEEHAKRHAEIEMQKNALVTNFIEIASDMFIDISESYLVNLLRERENKYPSDGELIDACIETIVALKGKYPMTKAKRKRSVDDDGQKGEGDEDQESDGEEADEEQSWGEGTSGGSSASNIKPKRDFMTYTDKMNSDYENQCATQLYQDFPLVTAASIRSCLKLFNFHYAPAFNYLHNSLAGAETISTGIKISLMHKPRATKAAPDPKRLDPDFRKELQFIKSKVVVVVTMMSHQTGWHNVKMAISSVLNAQNEEQKSNWATGERSSNLNQGYFESIEYRKEQEQDNVLNAQHKVEEKMTQALLRECPKCKSRFYKTEGENDIQYHFVVKYFALLML